MAEIGSPGLEDKKEVRKLVLAKRASLGESTRTNKSFHIQKKVLALSEYETAKTVMLFLNFRDEVETTELAKETLARGKRLVLPRCAPGGILIPAEIEDLVCDLDTGMWGIREPKEEGLVKVEPWEIDFVLVPGAAFDLTGNRLGYGAGYYDRFFEFLSPSVPRVAVAFACQVIPEVPVAEHDKKMSFLITEDKVYQFSNLSE
ncbi:MAG: 5-formyltetrahydrofolate cyclo-ligase [Desulfitobacteriaceae bacterium]